MEIVKHLGIKREPGYKYYADKDGNICKARLVSRSLPSGPPEILYKFDREPDWIYYVTQGGDLARTLPLSETRKRNKQGQYEKESNKLLSFGSGNVQVKMHKHGRYITIGDKISISRENLRHLQTNIARMIEEIDGVKKEREKLKQKEAKDQSLARFNLSEED